MNKDRSLWLLCDPAVADILAGSHRRSLFICCIEILHNLPCSRFQNANLNENLSCQLNSTAFEDVWRFFTFYFFFFTYFKFRPTMSASFKNSTHMEMYLNELQYLGFIWCSPTSVKRREDLQPWSHCRKRNPAGQLETKQLKEQFVPRSEMHILPLLVLSNLWCVGDVCILLNINGTRSQSARGAQRAKECIGNVRQQSLFPKIMT